MKAVIFALFLVSTATVGSAGPAAATSVPPSIWWNTIAVERAGSRRHSPGRSISAE